MTLDLTDCFVALPQLDVSNNTLCGVWTEHLKLKGTYNAEGITALSDALRVNRGLTKISLAVNALGEEGTKAICEALKVNKTLKDLDMSGTPGPYPSSNIGESAGAKHVADMPTVNGVLTKME